MTHPFICSFLFVFVIACARSQLSRLLLFGDSIDRYTGIARILTTAKSIFRFCCTVVLDWCALQQSKGKSVKQFSWGGDTLKYVSARGMMPSVICDNGEVLLRPRIAAMYVW